MSWWVDVAGAALRWKIARSAVIDASIYPIGNPEYRERLEALSQAEHKLNEALGPVDIRFAQLLWKRG